MEQDKLQQYRENDVVFSVKWFETYQSRLLFLLNNKWTKRWFRYCLRIRNCDCKLDVVINKITPNSFSYGGKWLDDERIELTTDFRTHDKYSKRLYFAFKPLWYILHAFDWALLDRVEALTKLDFGFSTLTQYPGSIGANNPADGYMYQNGDDSTWATVRGGAGSGANDLGDAWFVTWRPGATDGTINELRRSIFLFDTSALTSGATISATVMSLYDRGKADPDSNSPNVNIYLSTPANTNALVGGDYAQLGTTAQCDTALTYAGWSASAYNAFTFNATGIGNVSLTGISKFGCRNANKDVANSAPSLITNYANTGFQCYFANASGTSTDPKLVVTYTLPAGGGGAFLFNFI